jgi:hypothetical protein
MTTYGRRQHTDRSQIVIVQKSRMGSYSLEFPSGSYAALASGYLAVLSVNRKSGWPLEQSTRAACHFYGLRVFHLRDRLLIPTSPKPVLWERAGLRVANIQTSIADSTIQACASRL